MLYFRALFCRFLLAAHEGWRFEVFEFRDDFYSCLQHLKFMVFQLFFDVFEECFKLVGEGFDLNF